jgi:tetratricopeptide (TPR) repeat protein
MRIGANAAWDEDWERAIEAYRRAVSESPRDVDALTALGLACVSGGRLEEALEAYQQASVLAPDNPVLLQRIAEVQEQAGQGEAAAETYMATAQLYMHQPNSAHQVVKSWRDAVRVNPAHIQAHAQLLRYYQRLGKTEDAVTECLVLARLYQAQGDTERAGQIWRYARKLAPNHPEVQAIVRRVHGDERVAADSGKSAEDVAATQSEVDVLDLAEAVVLEPVVPEESPVDGARRKALAALATSVFEETPDVLQLAPGSHISKSDVDALIGQAVDFHTRGKVDEAIAAYTQAYEAGVGMTALHFNLGLLYQGTGQTDEAMCHLERAAQDPGYQLGSHLALGECYLDKGDTRGALSHFLVVLQHIDTRTVAEARAEELRRVYESLTRSYAVQGDPGRDTKLIEALTLFLSVSGWDEKAARCRRCLDKIALDGPILSLADLLTASDADDLLQALELIQTHVEQGLPYTALEECYAAIGHAPTHLVVHRQLAGVLLRMGRTDEAAAKLVAVGDTYRVRAATYQAIEMYNSALDLAPMDTTIRNKLIDLLASEGQIEQALEHYMALADSYYHLAQMDQARATYEKALQLAGRAKRDRRWTVRILHEIGDLDMQRVDWRHAVGVYRQIREHAPEDQRARLILTELYYRLGRSDLALAELDHLLNMWRKSGKSERSITALEELVHSYEDDIPLRTRVAQAYLDAGQTKQALIHLDKLGDLQLDAERYDDARATVEAIIALGPPNVAEYQRLLEQLG